MPEWLSRMIDEFLYLLGLIGFAWDMFRTEFSFDYPTTV